LKPLTACREPWKAVHFWFSFLPPVKIGKIGRPAVLKVGAVLVLWEANSYQLSAISLKKGSEIVQFFLLSTTTPCENRCRNGARRGVDDRNSMSDKGIYSDFKERNGIRLVLSAQCLVLSA
jgi:hypothetical protein